MTNIYKIVYTNNPKNIKMSTKDVLADSPENAIIKLRDWARLGGIQDIKVCSFETILEDILK